MRGLPQAVQACGRRLFGADLFGAVGRRGLIDANGDRVDGAEFHRAQPPERPGKQQMQAGPEHGNRCAEALVDAALSHLDELHPGQSPAKQRRAEHGRQYRGAQEGQRPAAREVQAEMGLQQSARRARATGDDAGENAVSDRPGVCRGRCRQEQPRQRPDRQLQHHEHGRNRDDPLRPVHPAEHRAASEFDAGAGREQYCRQQQQSAQRRCFGQLRRRESDHDAFADQRDKCQGEHQRGQYIGAGTIVGSGFAGPQQLQHQVDRDGAARHDDGLADTSRDPGVIEHLPPTGAGRGAPLFRSGGLPEARRGQCQCRKQAGQRQQHCRQYGCRQSSGNGLVCQGLRGRGNPRRQQRQQQ